MRSYIEQKNHIDSAVRELLRYTKTQAHIQKHRHPITFMNMLAWTRTVLMSLLLHDTTSQQTSTFIHTQTRDLKAYKTMADKFIYIPNDNTQNYPFCTLKLVVETFE